MRQPKLLDPTQSLKVGMLNQIENQFIRNGDEPIHWVIDQLFLIPYHKVKIKFICFSLYENRKWIAVFNVGFILTSLNG